MTGVTRDPPRRRGSSKGPGCRRSADLRASRASTCGDWATRRRACAGIVAKADELIHLDRLGLALQLRRAERIGRRRCRRMSSYVPRSDDHAPDRRVRLKPSREVGRVADRREVADLRGPDVADEGWAAVDANPELSAAHRDPAGTRTARCIAESGSSCPPSMVRLGAGGVEDRHHGVAHELHHRPTFLAARSVPKHRTQR